MGILPVGRAPALLPPKSPPISERVTRDSGRHLRADIEGDKQGSKGQCASSVTVPCCRLPAASRGGTRGTVGVRFSGVHRGRTSHAEGRLALGRSRGGHTVHLFKFNHHHSSRRVPGCAILALLSQRIPHVFSSRTVTEQRSFAVSYRSGASPYDHGAGMPRDTSPAGRTHW